LLKCSDCVVYPDFCEPQVSFMQGNKNFFPALKSRIGLPLCSTPVETASGGSYATSAIMFLIYHHLLTQGYTAFATEDQCNGVVTRRVDAFMEICALKLCTISCTGDAHPPLPYGFNRCLSYRRSGFNMYL
jgi:hypothetical protein